MSAKRDRTEVRGIETQRRPGRRQKDESRADELRERLVKWSYFPSNERPSLRRLAAALNTSHQLLSHLLVGLEDWEREKDLTRCRVLTKGHGSVMSEAEQMRWHRKFRRDRAELARSLSRREDSAHEARVEALMNAIYMKFRLTPSPPKPKDPMAIWTNSPEQFDTWSMLWSE
jgi:hypothetical protein